MTPELFGFAVFLLLTAVVGAGAILVSELLGPRRKDSEKFTPFECGVPPFESAREPFHVRFYLVGILFILFDIETVFVIPYIVLCEPLGYFGVIEMGCFVLVLALGLVYCWKRGALEWD